MLLGQDLPVLRRHHLDELEHMLLPTREQAPGHRALGELIVAVDELLQLLPPVPIERGGGGPAPFSARPKSALPVEGVGKPPPPLRGRSAPPLSRAPPPAPG